MSHMREAAAGDRMGRTLNRLVAVLGALVAASPFVLSFSDSIPATTNALLCGMAVVVLAVLNKRGHHPWAEWSALALGPWIVASPWLLQVDVVPWGTGGTMGGFAPGVSAHIAFGMALLIASTFVILRTKPWPLAADT